MLTNSLLTDITEPFPLLGLTGACTIISGNDVDNSARKR